MIEGYILIILGLLGICLGSFVNAAVWRLKVKKDIVHDRSECPKCHHKLSAIDLIPVVSWLLLGGKCRYCRKPISAQYPVVEVLVMIYFIASYLLWPRELDGLVAQMQFGLWLIAGVMLAILFVYDLRWKLLPDRVVFPLIGVGVIYFVLEAILQTWSLPTIFFEALYALIPISGIYGLLYIVSKGNWIGFGDVKLGVYIGLVLGWQHALLALFLANLLGVLVIIPGMLSGTLTRSSKIPFGPFLIAATVIAGLFGDQLITFYMRTIDQFIVALML